MPDFPPIEAYEDEGIKAQVAPILESETKPRGRSPQIEESSDPVIPNLVFPTSLRGKPIPEQDWIVDGWIPVGDVCLFYGDGGVGKTLLSQQLMVCTALGKPWCTLPVHRCISLGVFCEDDNDELHRRQDSIQRHLMTDFDDERLDSMCWWTRKGDDNLLCTFDYEGKIQLTPLYTAILEAAQKIGARLIILDTAADLFGGNENDRSQVRQFIGALSRLAMTVNGAVVLCAHPSRSGMASGTGDGGSTGWSNSARSRLSLERPKADGDAEADTNERLLTKKKANRSSIGDTIKLRWQDGVITSTRPAGLTSSTVLADALDADRVFLNLVKMADEEGRQVSANPRAGNYAPKAFAKNANRQGYGRREFEQAMERLFAAKRISTEEYGKTTGSGVKPRRIAVVTPPESE
jgi:RecA-family ATPase